MNKEKIIEKGVELLYMGSFDPVSERFPDFCSHTFTNSLFASDIDENGKPAIMTLTTLENQNKWLKRQEGFIRGRKDFSGVCSLVNKPYRLYYLKMCKPYMTNKEFSRYFGELWVMAENPNMDANVSLRELGEWFKKADKESLMEKEELEVYNSLEDEFEVFRGVSEGRVEKGFSFTRNFDKAKWFADRFGDGYIIKANVKKEDVLAYFSRRGEEECVINAYEIKYEKV